MSKFILIDGDIVNFMGVFGKAIVYVRPGILKASGKSTLKRKKICIVRDEKKVSVLGCTYYSPLFFKVKILKIGLWTKRKIVSGIFTLTNLEKYFSVSSEFNH